MNSIVRRSPTVNRGNTKENPLLLLAQKHAFKRKVTLDVALKITKVDGRMQSSHGRRDITI